jgi:guanylate kinase
VVISSPSGGGKTTVVERLLRRVPSLERSVSVTTRAPRPGERDGRDYRFVSDRMFRWMRRSNRLLEWAKVHGAYYGTPRRPVLEALAEGRRLILNIDVQGARQVRRTLGKHAVLVFLLPPSLQALEERLRRRRTESTRAIWQRLAAAKREMACARWYDATVVNDDVEDAVRRLIKIVDAAGGEGGRSRHDTGGD